MNPPFARNSPTSRAAAEEIQPLLSRLEQLVLMALKTDGEWKEPAGLTCDEVEQSLNLSHQTASARIRELYLAGAIEPARDAAGEIVTRKTRSGRKAQVWRVKGGGV